MPGQIIEQPDGKEWIHCYRGGDKQIDIDVLVGKTPYILPGGTVARSSADMLAGTVGQLTVNDGVDIVLDFTTFRALKLVLGDDRVIPAPIGLPAGSTFVLVIQQGSGGNKTATWDSAWVWDVDGAPTLQTEEGAVDIISGYYDGAVVRVSCGAGWAS